MKKNSVLGVRGERTCLRGEIRPFCSGLTDKSAFICENLCPISMKLSVSLKRLLLLAGLILFTLLVVTAARAAVTLIYFTGTVDGSSIRVAWGTASELDNAGFYVNRSTQPGAGFSRISGFFPSQGGIIGSDYVYDDTDVAPGAHYFYKLEMVSTTGDSEFTDAIEVGYGAPTRTLTPTGATPQTQAATNTSTAILTPSPTATETDESADTPTTTLTRTPTVAPTAAPTRTPTLAPFVSFTPRPTDTSTPTETATETETPENTSTVTTTLFPLAEITLQFPVYTPTGTATITPTPTGTLTPTVTITPTPQSRTLRQNFLLGTVGLLWLGLVVFVILFFRRMVSR
jgi:hypothetical protein